MKNIKIVSEKNENNNSYQIKMNVIFSEDKAPTIINYEGVSSLLEVVNAAKENGIDIIGEKGLKPAIDTGLIEIISKSDEKRIRELYEKIKEEQLKYSKKDNNQEPHLNIVKQKENNTSNDHEFTLSPELREFCEYLTLNLERSQRKLTSKQEKRLKELISCNEMAKETEKARLNAISKKEEFDSIEGQDSKEYIDAKKELDEAEQQYILILQKNKEILFEEYRKAYESLDKKEDSLDPQKKNSMNSEEEKKNIILDKDLVNIINDFCSEFDVKEETKTYLLKEETIDILLKYRNISQLKEIISALAYNYEVNILTTNEGNYRTYEDGNNYLTSFTRDFLCAKSVVNRYSAIQNMQLFGSNITSEELKNGFKNYMNTVASYEMTANSRLPFHYLTNNDKVSTDTLNELQDLLIIVNNNRENGTLNSNHTDDFISKVYDIFIQNKDSLKLSIGIKSVASSLVYAYVEMQSQIAKGEPLYLHNNSKEAQIGINIDANEEKIMIKYMDTILYEFNSLFNIKKYKNSNSQNNDKDRRIEEQKIESSLRTMQSLKNTTKDVARLNLANALYLNGLNEYAEKISSGEINKELLNKIISVCPSISSEVETYIYASSEDKPIYIEFDEICNDIDCLLNIQNRKENNYTALLIVRKTTNIEDNYQLLSNIKFVKEESQQEEINDVDLTPDKEVEIDPEKQTISMEEQMQQKEEEEKDKLIRGSLDIEKTSIENKETQDNVKQDRQEDNDVTNSKVASSIENERIKLMLSLFQNDNNQDKLNNKDQVSTMLG